jgi:tetratricopeptide (TPR) repeat protein
MQGKLDAAVAEYGAAIRINPNDGWAHHNLGDILATQGKLDAAVAAYRAAIRIRPDFAEAHCDLGRALRKQGNYAASLDELRTGHALGSKRSDWPYASADSIRQAERLVALGDGLAAILRGTEQPKDNAERLAVAQVYCDRNRPAAAARLRAKALEADPRLGDDLRTGLRFEAASAAALAGCGRGQDDPPPSETRKAELRRQALDWLKLDLTLRSQQLATADARKDVARAMTRWSTALDLGGVRDSEALAKLPDAEREEWRALWADVEALLKRAGGWAP